MPARQEDRTMCGFFQKETFCFFHKTYCAFTKTDVQYEKK